MRVIAAEAQSQSLAQRTTELSAETRIQNTTTQSLQRQSDSLAEGRRILSETSASVAGANQQAAQTKAERGTNTFAGLVDVGVQLADRAAKITLTHQERELKRREALKKQAEAEKEARRQEALTRAESIGNDIVLAQRTNGTLNTLEGVRAVINDPDFQGVITAEDKRELERRFQARIRETEDNIYRDTERSIDEINKEKFRNVEAKLIYDTSAYVSRLTRVNNPNEQNAIVTEILENSVVAATNADLGLADQLRLRTRVMEEAARAVSTAQAESLGINDTVTQLSYVTEQISQLEIALANGPENGGIDWATYQNQVNYLMATNPRVKGINIPTAESARDEAINRESSKQKLRQLAKENYEFENQVPVLENSIIAQSALEIVADPSLRVKYDQLDTGDNRRVLELADHLASIKNSLADPAQTTKLASSHERRVKAQALLQSIAQYRNNPQLWADAKKAGQPVPDVSDLAVAKAQADYDQASSEYQAVSNEISTNLAELEKFGVAFDSSTGQLGINQQVADELSRALNTPTGGGSPGGGGGSFAGIVAPGFNQGGVSGGYTPPLGKTTAGKNGTVKMVPAAKQVHKSHWEHTHAPGAHKFDFTIEDTNGNVTTAVPSPVTGEVTDVYYEPGYGNLVSVWNPNTNISYLIAHLHEPSHLQVGQKILEGEKVGLQGNVGTRSSGEHVHLELWRGKKPWVGDAAPLTNRAEADKLARQYTAKVLNGNWASASPNSLGLPPSQGLSRLPVTTGNVPTYVPSNSTPPPPGAMVLPGGGYILGGVLRLPQVRTSTTTSAPQSGSQFNNNRPLNMPQASRYRRDYPAKNNPTANYGYTTLKDDPAFARALAATADRLDIPAQWLADVMAFESTQNGIIHNPAAMNAEGAVGLIQFYPGGGLAEVAKGMGVSEAEASRRLRGMTRAQQMPWVENHLKLMLRYAGKERYERMDDVFAAIFGGQGLLAKSDAERQGVGDSAITYAQYRKQIGSHVGRSYSTERGSRQTHTKHHGNCPTCNQMMQTQGRVIPHQAP